MHRRCFSLLFLVALALAASGCGDLIQCDEDSDCPSGSACTDEGLCVPVEEVPREGMVAGECSDDADNDGDGLFDCDDPDCAGAQACAGDDDTG
ncbi:MAG TPA: hypothetical protein DIU15_17055, partial [Deltaproteobacteria bacterium]|nr:hypothetical protein [Deltaproteobacteria bacterium]